MTASLGPSRLSRLALEAMEPFAPIDITLRVVTSPRGLSGLRMDLSGAILQVCQRCMMPVEIDVGRRALFEMVDSTAALDADDDEHWDRMLHSDRFDLLQVVEDELLLALPFSARHAACEPAGTPAVIAKAMPFAGLAVLREHKHE